MKIWIVDDSDEILHLVEHEVSGDDLEADEVCFEQEDGIETFVSAGNLDAHRTRVGAVAEYVDMVVNEGDSILKGLEGVFSRIEMAAELLKTETDVEAFGRSEDDDTIRLLQEENQALSAKAEEAQGRLLGAVAILAAFSGTGIFFALAAARLSIFVSR